MATTTKQQTSSKPQPPAIPTVADAEAVVARLQVQQEQLRAERQRVEGETGRHAFAAHARSDMKAVEALDQIATTIMRLDSRIREIDLALSEAGRFLQEARQAEARAADQARAAEARELARELGKVFPYLDRKLAEAANALIAINDGIAKLHQAGFAFPSDSQLRLGVAAILQSWAHRLPRSWHDQLRDGFEFLAPGRRQTAVEYWAQIQASIDNQINQRLDKTEQPSKERAA
jgi:ABC-type transporter Mla subunit MlaD